ncbi:CHAT domain-containing protein [Actinomadura darangshiensis]|uniref:CHAT domain-containing protein n=1 Tax=Actinomadura darangshiensis TaxID=705336 RepID=A0A4R5BRG8_9ACTN|nr:CHAT domain-containing protein [Actinomadura darangshiensis]TDD86692.1 CHAT domain-containing protein [Actinomadura darangshiensis]
MSDSDERLEIRIGCTSGVLWVPILSALVTVLLGGPWWAPLSCLAVLVMGYAWAILVTGVLVYFTWGTSWVAVPLVFLAGSTLQRIWYQPWRVRQRGMRWFAAYLRTNRRAHLRRAVKALRRALASASPQDPNRAMFAGNYASALVALHGREDMPQVLDQAERLCRQALAALPAGHPHRVTCLSSLSGVLQARYARDNDRTLLEEIVHVSREAVAAPHDDDEAPAVLSNLGGALLLLYERTASAETLQEGLRVSREALAAAQPGSPYTYGLRGNLNSALLVAYSVDMELAALEEAVQLGRQVVAATPPGSLMADSFPANLANTLVVLFERTRRTELLDEAVELAHDALAECPPDHPERDAFFSTLGRVLLMAAEFGDRPDLADEAVAALREAATIIPARHVKRADRLDDLCAALTTSFTVHRRPDDVTEAVRAGRESLSVAPHDDPGRGLRLARLGRALEARYDHNGDPADLAESCRTLATAAETTSAPVTVRVEAARRAAEVHIRAQDHRAALAMAELAVEQIPRVAPRRLGFDDRVQSATGMTGLAATAAEAAIGAGEPGRAVELLEQARGVVLNGMFDLRGDLTELRSRDPGLAGELDDLVRAIERADETPLPADRSREALSELRTRLNRQWDELLARIRAHDGLGDFLLPPPVGRLREQATEGPIACVTTHRTHGSALIVTDDPTSPVIVVDLPQLTREAVDERVAALQHAHRVATEPGAATRRRQAQQDVLRILEWLWDAAAAPVLTALDITGLPADGQWPRIWWCPVGPCVFLPLHAAGRHADGGHDTVIDRVISSYTTTIRALAHARRSRPGPRRRPSALVVSVPDAPGAARLPGATAEAELLGRLPLAPKILHSPGRTAVTDALPHHEIAHFACHGVADTHVPTDSRLLLKDHLDQPLTVSAIGRLRLDRGELAYLSACSTTDTSERHADEAVHVTAAFQLVGYRSVVGTLWPVNDRAAATIAENFYTNLTRAGSTVPDPTAGAPALHHAVHAHRARYPGLPTQWASYIHHGP